MSNHLRLYLDDERPCPEGWTLATTVEQARLIINNHEGTFECSLDFDLGADDDLVHEKGVMLILWFTEAKRYPTNVYLHTANPWGMKSMDWALKDMEKAKAVDDDIWESGAYA